jgi:hypothetical protein
MLVCQRAKAIAGISTKGVTPWSHFTLEKLYDEEGVTIDVRMICVTCTTSLTISNPSQSFKNHLNADKTGCNTMSKVEAKMVATSSGHHFDKVSKKPKESRLEVAQSTQLKISSLSPPLGNTLSAKNYIARFFYCNNVALHLIEDERLVKAFAVLGVQIPNRQR